MSIGTLCRAVALCVGALIALPACTVRTGPPTADAYVYSRPPTAAVYSAPRGYYSGNTYYWYDNRWWYESPRGWAYLREEPRPLYRYRTERWRPGVGQPPPAYERPYGYGGGPPPSVAPPKPAPR
jgi:hypothetical protein